MLPGLPWEIILSLVFSPFYFDNLTSTLNNAMAFFSWISKAQDAQL
jgi:hypothetical protein